MRLNPANRRFRLRVPATSQQREEIEDFPLLSEEGWLRAEEDAAKHQLLAQTGWCKVELSTSPPLLLQLRWLRDISLVSRPPLLEEEGKAPNSISSQLPKPATTLDSSAAVDIRCPTAILTVES